MFEKGIFIDACWLALLQQLLAPQTRSWRKYNSKEIERNTIGTNLPQHMDYFITCDNEGQKGCTSKQLKINYSGNLISLRLRKLTLVGLIFIVELLKLLHVFPLYDILV